MNKIETMGINDDMFIELIKDNSCGYMLQKVTDQMTIEDYEES